MGNGASVALLSLECVESIPSRSDIDSIASDLMP